MKKSLFISGICLILFFSCKEKKDNPEQDTPISAISVIKGQLIHLDTSLYQITKFEISGDITDTTWLKREEVKQYGSVFLSLPDIADKNYNSNYTEERLIDASQGKLSITATAKNEDAEILKQILVIDLEGLESGKLHSIFIDRFLYSKDSTVQQKLYWEIDAYFSVNSIIQKENQPEKTHKVRVEWK